MKLGVRTGSIGALRDGSAAMSTTAADRAGVRVGGNLHLFLGDGAPVTVTVVAIYARGLGFPDLTMPHDVIAAHVDDPLDSVVLVHGRPGLRKPLDQAVHGYAGATTVATDAGPEPPSISEQGADTSVQYLVLILIVGFSAIAGVNTMLMSTADRRGEFATLRLLGTTRTQVRRMVRCEASLLVVICGALGTVLSLSTITAFSIGVTGSMPYIPTLPYVAILGGTAVLVLGTTEVAVRAFPDLWLHQN
jgi:putative ABC transport system permease protein